MTERQPLSAGYGAIVTALLALATYLLALHNGFAFDDAVLIPRDARVTNGELGALIIEASVYALARAPRDWGRALAASALANAASYASGLVLPQSL